MLFLPESVKYLVHRGKGVAQVKRIAQRFMSGSLEQVTQFYLDEDRVTVKRQRGTAIQYATAAGHADALDDLLYGIGYLLRAVELDANADAGNGLSAG